MEFKKLAKNTSYARWNECIKKRTQKITVSKSKIGEWCESKKNIKELIKCERDWKWNMNICVDTVSQY